MGQRDPRLVQIELDKLGCESEVINVLVVQVSLTAFHHEFHSCHFLKLTQILTLLNPWQIRNVKRPRFKFWN